MPTVSVIIAAYNAADFLEEAVVSALRQTYSDLEVVVVDDGSTDSTPAVIERLAADSRVRHARQPNRGASAARNAAIRVASGEYCLVLDADDLLVPMCAERLLTSMQQSGAQWATCDLIRAAGEEQRLVRSSIPSVAALEYTLASFYPYKAVCFRRDALIAVGAYDESLPVCEDCDLYARLLIAGTSYCYVPEPLYIYRIRPLSLTKGTSFLPNLLVVEQLLDRYHKPRFSSARVRSSYAYHMLSVARQRRELGAPKRDILRALYKSLLADARYALAVVPRKLGLLRTLTTPP